NTFGYPTANNTLSSYSKWADYEAINSTFAWSWRGDFNGDGKTDLLYLPTTWATNGWRVMTSTGTSLSGPTTWASYEAVDVDSNGNPGTAYVGDVNGDGKDDFVYLSANHTNGWRVMISNGTSFAAPVTWAQYDSTGVGPVSSFNFTYLVDMNSDGKADFLFI